MAKNQKPKSSVSKSKKESLAKKKQDAQRNLENCQKDFHKVFGDMESLDRQGLGYAIAGGEILSRAHKACAVLGKQWKKQFPQKQGEKATFSVSYRTACHWIDVFKHKDVLEQKALDTGKEWKDERGHYRCRLTECILWLDELQGTKGKGHTSGGRRTNEAPDPVPKTPEWQWTDKIVLGLSGTFHGLDKPTEIREGLRNGDYVLQVVHRETKKPLAEIGDVKMTGFETEHRNPLTLKTVA